MVTNVGAIAAKDALCSEYMLSRIFSPATYEFFNFGFEEDCLEDAAVARDPRRTGASTVDLCPMIAGERRVQEDVNRDDAHRAVEDRRTWQLLCSQLLSANEEAVPDEDLLALLLSYLKSGCNSRKLAT